MRLAVLDLGSFSFHLAIFRAERPHALERIGRYREPVRLAAGITANGHIDDATWWRATASLARLVRETAQSQPDRFAVVATSAVREAGNGPAFAAHLRWQFDLSVEILAGDDEARLGYWGARAGVPGVARRVATIDLGGGSVQIAVGDERSCRVACSLPLGVLRTRPLGDQALRCHVAREAAPVLAAVRACSPERLLLSGGSARRLVRLAFGLGLARGGTTELTRSSLQCILAALERLESSDLTALGIEESRHGTLRAAAITLDSLLAVAGAPAALVTPGGLREGVALRELLTFSTAATRDDGDAPVDAGRHYGQS